MLPRDSDSHSNVNFDDNIAHSQWKEGHWLSIRNRWLSLSMIRIMLTINLDVNSCWDWIPKLEVFILWNTLYNRPDCPDSILSRIVLRIKIEFDILVITYIFQFTDELYDLHFYQPAICTYKWWRNKLKQNLQPNPYRKILNSRFRLGRKSLSEDEFPNARRRLFLHNGYHRTMQLTGFVGFERRFL